MIGDGGFRGVLYPAAILVLTMAMRMAVMMTMMLLLLLLLLCYYVVQLLMRINVSVMLLAIMTWPPRLGIPELTTYLYLPN